MRNRPLEIGLSASFLAGCPSHEDIAISRANILLGTINKINEGTVHTHLNCLPQREDIECRSQNPHSGLGTIILDAKDTLTVFSPYAGQEGVLAIEPFSGKEECNVGMPIDVVYANSYLVGAEECNKIRKAAMTILMKDMIESFSTLARN